MCIVNTKKRFEYANKCGFYVFIIIAFKLYPCGIKHDDVQQLASELAVRPNQVEAA